MPLLGHSLLDINDLSEADVIAIFETAKRIRHLHKTNKIDFGQLLQANANKYVAMMFFEPSTRTRSSFEVAAYKLGLQALAPEFGPSSSRVKGESMVDTFLNVSAMDPDAIVVRFNDSPELVEVLRASEIPVINGGSGQSAHPTQALLDSFTMQEELGALRGKKVLLIGDIRHSRVAQSNLKLLEMMGAQVALAGPEDFLPRDSGHQLMETDAGIEWADVVMALRIQLERHAENSNSLSKEQYNKKYGISLERMKKFGAGILMHPGPINQGVELDAEVLKDPRSRVLQQVRNGVYIRSAVLSMVLGIKI